MEATLGSGPSQVWRAILEGRDTLGLGLLKEFGGCMICVKHTSVGNPKRKV
jgi:hypothetical protein